MGPEQTRLMDRLFNDPERQLVNFKITPGPNPGSKEDLCRELNKALDEIESGQAEEVGPASSGRPQVDVKELVKRL